jgi:hypothetical protein
LSSQFSDGSGHAQVGGQLLRDTISALGTSPSDCALITATPATIHDAQDIGLPAIGYALTPEADQRLTDAGTDVLVRFGLPSGTASAVSRPA